VPGHPASPFARPVAVLGDELDAGGLRCRIYGLQHVGQRVRADLEQSRIRIAQIDNDLERRRDSQSSDRERYIRHRMPFGQQTVAAEEEGRPGHDDGEERIIYRIDQGQRHLQPRLTDRSRVLQRAAFCLSDDG
jgi:hypothetical protein